MTLSEECQLIGSRPRIIWKHLESSEFSGEFKRIRDLIGSSNPRQILWHAIHGDEIPSCNCGSPLSWHQDKHRYRDYCSKRCTAVYSQDKIRQTNLSKRGVEHHSKTKEYRNKVRETSLARFGVEHYSKTNEFKDRTVSTNMEKFGVAYPAQDLIIRQKIKKTMLSRHGVSNPMHSDEIKSRQILTNLNKYGSPNPLSSPIIRSKVSETLISTYGVSNPMYDPSIRSRSANTRRINHYTAYAYQRIHDPEWLRLQNESGMSIGEIAEDLGISSSNLCKIFHKHGVDIKKHFRSAMERDLTDHYRNLGFRIESNVRSVISPYEIDVWFPDHNLGVELNGAYYHSERQGKHDRYHLTKTLKASENGITLLQFFDWEMFEKKDLITDKINHLLELSKRIGARTLDIRDINDNCATEFYDENHLQGSCYGQHHLGLYDSDGNLLAAMSFGKSRYTDRYTWELLRFASKIGHSIVGGADRLLKRFIFNKCKPQDQIVSYCNRRWSSGGLYQKLGFQLSHESPPGYYYITKNGTYAGTRQQWQKHLLADKLEKFDPNLSENENMIMNGYSRVWDCGQLVFTKTID